MTEEEKENNWSAAKEHAEKYLSTLLELYKLKFTERASFLGSSVLSSLVVYLVLLFCILFLSVTIAVLVGMCTGHAYLGFAAVTLFYLLLFILLLVKRKRWIKRRIMNFLIRKIYEQ